MHLTHPADVTEWLRQRELGSPGVANQLFELLYQDLRRIARAHMAKEAADHTLSATVLTHEAWFRMAEQSRTAWQNRAHFLSVASTMMRRILINHALGLRADKRLAQQVSLTLTEAQQVALAQDADVVDLHEALLAFEAIDPRAARVVELKFFGGLENDEIAQVLAVSVATVKRDWVVARAWLRRNLDRNPATAPRS